MNGSAEAGINRAEWDLRYDSPVQAGGFGGGGGGGRGGAAGAPAEIPGAKRSETPGGGAGRGGAGGGGGGFGFGGGRGPMVDPGEYTIAVAALGKTESKTATVEEDPRIRISAEDRTERRKAITKVYAMAREADSAGARKSSRCGRR